jgi:hypothetical protein
MSKPGGIIHILIEDYRLRISIGDGRGLIADCQIDQLLRREIIVASLLRTHLGYVPILAEFAIDITAGGRYRKSGGPGKEMEKRLLLYGIDVETAGTGVDQSKILPLPVLSDPTVASLPIGNFAASRTELAFNNQLLEFLIVTRLLSRQVPRQFQSIGSGTEV